MMAARATALCILLFAAPLAVAQEIEAPPGDVRARLGDAEKTIRLTRSECEALLARYIDIQNDLGALEAALTFSEQFFLVQRTLNEVREVLSRTGADSAEAVKKVREFEALLRVDNERLRDTVKQLTGGLERAGKTMTDVSKTLDQIAQAMEVVEVAVGARDANAKATLLAFAEYYRRVSKPLDPLIKALPVVGVFLKLYEQMIVTIAGDAAKLEAEVIRRNRLYKDLSESDQDLYISAPTERERKQRAIAQKRAELAGVAQDIREQCNNAIRFENGQPVFEDPMFKLMDQARERVRIDGREMEDRAGEAWNAVRAALAALTAAKERHDSASRTSAPYLREDLARLQKALAAQPNDTETRRLKREIARRERELREIDESAELLRKERARYAEAVSAARRLEGQWRASQRESLVRLAKLRGWDPWWIHFRYPDLF
jgi:hypothetical protein